MFRRPSFFFFFTVLADRRSYLEGLVSDEREKRDGPLGVAPRPGLAGSTENLPVLEPNAELQSYVGGRLLGRPATTRQGNVEPNVTTTSGC